MKKIKTYTLIGLSIIILAACKKKNPTPAPADTTQQDVINSLATNVDVVAYNELAASTSSLYDAVTSFCASPSASGLTICRDLWKSTRQIWEQSEGFLYGPVESDNIDPRIDTWPVDYNSLDSVLASSMTFSEVEINNLDDALKGFHPMEYLLFGQGGTKTYDQFTAREKEYLIALGLNIKTLTQDLSSKWSTATANNYYNYFTTPSTSNPYYHTEKDVYMEIVNAMIDICNEVGNEKIKDPYLAQDPSLEESPFAMSSLNDFTNNIISVQNVYHGKFSTDNLGLEDFVKKYNLSLDQNINTKINAAIASLNNINGPFSSAIINQHVQIQNAINAINDLKDVLESDLIPFVQTYVK